MYDPLFVQLRAIWKWWWLLVVGVAAGIWGVIEVLRSSHRPIWMWVSVALLFLNAAQFLALREAQQQLSMRPTEKGQLKQNCLTLAKEVLDFVDERRRLADAAGSDLQYHDETIQIYRRRFEERVWLMAQTLDGHGYPSVLADLKKWQPGEFEATGDLGDIEEFGSRLRIAAESIS